ncbi:copper chaperone PCu(A)C [Pseudofrankia sp. DC12]|uniref:copper chaperone PCu(A)C n=1 Tax=Pseudofrankia sp. DC12 TaxID=683315 RepID=UPI0006985E60|nr:copper chaperone PCu(A)C [Pseudofrankia sp. DC12]
MLTSGSTTMPINRSLAAAGRTCRLARRAVPISLLVAALLVAGCAAAGSRPTTPNGAAAGPRGTAPGIPPATDPAAAADTGSGDLGSLRIRGAYIPQQASPDVAAAYFTIENDGKADDDLISATTPAARSVSLHTTVDHGGAATMVPLTGLTIPAHGTAALTVGHAHLMLVNPVRMLTKGQRVTLTLSFAHAGRLQLVVPVVGFTGPNDTGEDVGGMGNMPGMGE